MSVSNEMHLNVKVAQKIDAKISLVGEERTPIIVIDDFLEDSEDVIRYAINHCQFSSDAVTYYPGVRAFLPQYYLAAVVQVVAFQLYRLYSIPLDRKVIVQPSYFSLITKQAHELSLVQKLPHFDTGRPHYFALLHYLNEGDHGGTGFFRHVPTGYERITETIQNTYLASVEHHLTSVEGALQPGYITQSNTHFELISEVPYRPNRLVVYPGNLLHSGLLKLPRDIDPNPITGRLTANTFIEYV